MSTPRRSVPTAARPLPEWALPPGSRGAGPATGGADGGVDGGPRRVRKRRRWGLRLLALLVAVPLVGAAALFVYAQGLRTELPDIYALQREATASSSTAYTADGVVLARYHHLHRRWVRLDAVARPFVDALIATEDKRFYEHAGVDWRRFLSSLYFTARGRTQGGSTLTMQLARNLFPDDIGSRQTLRRKAKEILTAQRFEQAFTKQEILEMYVNTMPFGLNAFGVEAASQVYFSRPAASLDIGQAALLVATLKGTTRYNPVRNETNARTRRNLVLDRMVTAGMLSPTEAMRVQETPLGLEIKRSDPSESPAPHFADYVAQWVEAWCEERGCDVYRDGLRIYTTLDSRIQARAAEAVAGQADDLDRIAGYEWSSAGAGTVGSAAAARTSRPYAYFWSRYPRVVDGYVRDTDRYRSLVAGGASGPEALSRLRGDAAFMDSLREARMRLEVGLVAVEPQTGFVRAWVGGRDHAVDQFDHVAQARRQPGSTFKAFVYTAAIDWGMRPDDTFRDIVRTYDDGGGRSWTPSNSGGGASGASVTLRQALTYSKNTVTAQITSQIGPGYVARIARRMGIASDLREVPSLGLGTSEVTLLELVSSYGTLAAGGVHYAPIVVTRIEDREGRVIADFTPVSERAVGSGVAYTVLDMLRGVVDQGTGRGLRSRYGLRGDLAGKTGTTQLNADGWFVALTPRLAIGSWVGFNDRRVAFRSMQWGQGGSGALSLVGATLVALSGTDAAAPDSERFATPPGFEGLATPPDPEPDAPPAFDDGFGDDTPTEAPDDRVLADPLGAPPRDRALDEPDADRAPSRSEALPRPPASGATEPLRSPARTAPAPVRTVPPRPAPPDTGTARRRPPARVGW